MEEVDAVGNPVFNQHSVRIALNEGRGGVVQLIGQQEGRLFMAQVGHPQLANGATIPGEADGIVENPGARSAAPFRSVHRPRGAGAVRSLLLFLIADFCGPKVPDNWSC